MKKSPSRPGFNLGLGLGLFLAQPVDAYAAATITNPSFEKDKFEFDVKTPFTNVDGWKLTESFGGGGYQFDEGQASGNVGKMNYSPEGRQWIEIDTYPDEKAGYEFTNEIVGLEIDQVYTLTFSYFNGGSASAAIRVGAVMDLGEIEQSNLVRLKKGLEPVDFGDVAIPDSAGEKQDWSTFRYTFAATSDTMPLNVSGTMPHLYLDNFAINAPEVTQVPEPAGAAMLALASLGLLTCRRDRQS